MKESQQRISNARQQRNGERHRVQEAIYSSKVNDYRLSKSLSRHFDQQKRNFQVQS